MKKIVALSALALAASAGSAFGQFQYSFETRILVQTITGGNDASRVVMNSATTTFGATDRVRLTVQYRINVLGAAPAGPVTGTTGFQFNIDGSGSSTGTVSRSGLTNNNPAGGPFATFMGENGGALFANSTGYPTGVSYPQSGFQAGETGLHNMYRFGLNGIDSGNSNGTIVGDDINAVAAISTSNPSQNAGNWWGLYSFEYQSTAAGSKTFAVTTNQATLQIYRNGSAVLLDNVEGGNPAQEVQFLPLPSVSLQFGDSNTAPTASTTNATITANPLVNPDANNLTLATFTDANVADNIDVTITNDGGIGALGGVVSAIDGTTGNARIALNWDAPNAAIGQTFTVTFSYTDGIAAAQTGTVTVQVIPAPGAAALLGLGGLLAARRRRA